MPRCNLCFKERPNLQQPMPKFPAQVCKGCFYEIDRVVGFIMHYGGSILLQGELALKPPKSPKKRSKSKSGQLGEGTDS